MALVFVSGAVVGGFANRLYMMRTVSASTTGTQRRGVEFRRQYVEEMRTRLHLTEPQLTQLQQIMDSTGKKMREMHRSVEEEHVRQVVAMLDDTQRAEYAKMREERDRHRHQQDKKGQ
jgi:Spy/CpxP family protein refolding chaperone